MAILMSLVADRRTIWPSVTVRKIFSHHLRSKDYPLFAYKDKDRQFGTQALESRDQKALESVSPSPSHFGVNGRETEGDTMGAQTRRNRHLF